MKKVFFTLFAVAFISTSAFGNCGKITFLKAYDLEGGMTNVWLKAKEGQEANVFVHGSVPAAVLVAAYLNGKEVCVTSSTARFVSEKD